MKEKKTKTSKKETVKETKRDVKVTKKETVKKEAKETKKVSATKKKDEALLNKDDQKRFKTLSRVVKIISKIVRIVLMISVPFILMLAIIIPIMFSKIEVSGNIVKFNDARFVLKDDYITLNVGEKTHLIADGIKNMDQVVSFLNDNKLSTLIASFEVALIGAVVAIIINIYIFKDIEKLFDNFYLQKTPLTDENTEYIHNIGKKMIYLLLSELIFGIITTILAKNTFNTHIATYSIIEILIIYVIYYIFKYASNLQKQKESTIYD